MQIKSNASLAFIDLSPEKKTPIGTQMADALKSHPDLFPSPPLSNAELTQLNADLSGAVVKARSGDKTAGAALLNIEKKWDGTFRSYAKYVSSQANGNEETIRAGGCEPTKNESSPAQKPGVNKNVQVMAEHGKGTVSVSCDADTAVKAYLFAAHTKGVQVRQDGDSVIFETPGGDIIVVQPDTHRKIMFHNLQSDTRVWVSVMPLNNAGSGPLSDEQSVTPQ